VESAAANLKTLSLAGNEGLGEAEQAAITDAAPSSEAPKARSVTYVD